MNLLFLSPRECWPPTSGAKLRDFHLARALSRGSDLTYVFFGNSETEGPLKTNLPSARCVRAVPAPVKYSVRKVIRGLVGRYPLPIQNYTSDAMTRCLQEIISGQPFDVIHLDSIHMAAYMPMLKRLLPRARIVLDWHNIESELMERFAVTTTSAARKLYARVTARQLRTLEQRMLRECDGHLVCSERELNLLTERNRAARVALSPNGVDTSYFSPASNCNPTKRLVFVGQMAYHGNAEGAIWFVREVWPALRAQDSKFELSIVGASPGPAVQALAQEPGVEVTGTVADVRPYYAGAYASVVPLLTGGGTRLKILEAMAAGVPVVSTRLGAEGIPIRDRRHFLSAETPTDWLTAFDWLKDPVRRRELVENGHGLVVSQFDWNAIGERVLTQYSDWMPH